MKTVTKKSLISFIIVLAMIINLVSFGSISVYADVGVTTIFQDDFENYDVDTTISSGKTPYTVIYDGTGGGNQKIITSTQKDGSEGKVLQLQGTSGWAAEIKRTFTPDDKQYLVFKTDIKPVSGSSPGGVMISSSKAGGGWTHSVCRVGLENGGFFYGKNDSTGSISTDFKYSNGNWYHLTLILDRTKNLQYIIMDDTIIGSFPADPAKPEWIDLCAGNKGTNTIYLDNIQLYTADIVDEVHTHILSLVPAKEATCSSTGNNAYYICSGCKKVFTDESGTVETTVVAQTISVNPTAHDWSSGSVTTPATCTTTGVKTYTCNHDSNHTKTETVAKESHTLKAIVAVAPTCVTDGVKAHYECSVCNKLFTNNLGTVEITSKDIIDSQTGHDWGEWIVNTPATEESVGEEYRVCKNDPTHKETREIPKLVHTHKLTLVPAKEATCSSTGNNAYYTCSGCNKVFTDSLGTVETTVVAETTAINSTAHNWNSGIVTTPATCTSEGVKTYTCNHDSNHTKTETVAKMKHTLVHVKELAATCTTDGNNEYYKCSVCDQYFTDALGTSVIADKSSVIRKATDHDWGEWLETTPATVDDKGVKTRICKNDSLHKETATIERLPYAILEGDNQTIVMDSGKELTVRANGTFEKFVGLQMDGKNIDSKYYTAVSGSTIVTLSQDFLNTLDEGEHTLTFVYTDGKVDSTIKKAKTANLTSPPQTGDNNKIWIYLLVISAFGIMSTIRFRKKMS